MAEVEKYAQDLLELVGYAEEFKSKVSRACGGSFKWGVNQVIDSYLSMFERFCPFSVGDRVELINDVKVEEGSGWWGCKHFLVRGAKATVRERGYSNGKFSFHIEFDRETWMDREGNEHPVTRKHIFHFSESSLRAEQKN